MKLSKAKSASRILRYEKVLVTLIKYGFEDIAVHPPLNKIIPQRGFLVPSRNGVKVNEYSRQARIRMVCEELGTTFIKFAQIASNRPDLLSDDLITELSLLQDKAPVVPITKIMEILETELPRPLDELVEYFDPTPIASASMAQVHRARLRGGKDVVLKIQRPNIYQMVMADISIMKSIVSVIEKYLPKYNIYHPRELVKMFEQSITKELSFNNEALNQKAFGKMFSENEDIKVPVLYAEICTDKILCMEYIDGCKITDLKSLASFGVDNKEIARKGINLYFQQVFDHGFFHADPHPGNILIKNDGQIVFLDYGMMGFVREDDKKIFSSILVSLYQGDVSQMKKSILKYSPELPEEKIIELEYDLLHILKHYRNIDIQNIDGNQVMKGLNSLFFDYKIKLPANLLLLLKALIIIEGVGLQIDPEYDIVENIGPFLSKLLINKKQRLKNIINSIDTTTNLINELPEDITTIIEKIKTGKLHIEFEHKGLEEMNKNIDIISNRISFTLIIFALLVSSSLLVLADIPPKIYNIPIIGFVGFVIATIMAIRLLYAIAKHGKI